MHYFGELKKRVEATRKTAEDEGAEDEGDETEK